MKYKLMIMTLGLFFSLSNFAKDIYGDGAMKIAITHPTPGFVSFHLCPKDYKETQVHLCQRIGKQEKYPIKLLEKQQNEEIREVGYATVGDVAGVLFFPVAVGVGVNTMVALAVGTTVAATVQTGVIVAGQSHLKNGAIYVLASLNPIDQYRDVRLLSTKVLYDQDVTANELTGDDYVLFVAERLANLLEKATE